MKTIKVNEIKIANNLPFVLIAGPCQLESRDHALYMSSELKQITDRLEIGFVYKTSFDKANRTSLNSQRGLGIDIAKSVFDEIFNTVGCPIITDVHEVSQCNEIAKHVDMLQIPAFLCRQTDLLLAAGGTGLPINVKKGQFLSPEDMINIIRKIESTGNDDVLLCERGTTFGYNNLVVDFRSLPIMAETGKPIVMDATHAVQKPGGQGTTSGGDRRFVPPLAKAALSIGIAALFLEVHEDPDNALSDGPNMLRLDKLEELLIELKQFDRLVK